jgi:hypothetical protein
MTNPTSVLQQVRSLGVDIRPDGDKLQLRPPGKLSAELLAAVREHKPEIIALLQKPSPSSRTLLTGALAQKNDEILTMRQRLASPYYAGDGEYQRWGQDVIVCLQAHVTEIQRYLSEGGTLGLPLCCKEEGHICLIAMRRFDGCLMVPGECTFSIREVEC